MNVQIGICNWDGSPTNRAVIETMRQQLKCPAYFKSIFLDSPIAVGTLASGRVRNSSQHDDARNTMDGELTQVLSAIL